MRRKAAEVLAAAEAKRILDTKYPDGFPQIEDPLEAMMQLAAESWAAKEFFREKIEELRYTSHAGEQLRSEVALWERAMDRCQRVLAEVTRLGIAERRQRIQEAQAVLILRMLERVHDALDLQPDQRTVWAEVVPRELRALSATDASPAPA